MERNGHLLLPLHHISSISSIQETCNLWVSLTLSSPTSYPSLCPISFLFDVFTFPVYSVSIHNRKGTYTYLIIWDNALAHQALCSAFYMHRLSAVCHQHSRCCRALPICIIIFPLFFFFFETTFSLLSFPLSIYFYQFLQISVYSVAWTKFLKVSWYGLENLSWHISSFDSSNESFNLYF